MIQYRTFTLYIQGLEWSETKIPDTRPKSRLESLDLVSKIRVRDRTLESAGRQLAVRNKNNERHHHEETPPTAFSTCRVWMVDGASISQHAAVALSASTSR